MGVGFFGIFLKVEQGLAVLDFLDLAVMSVTLDPSIHESFELLGISFVLSVKGMIIIVFTGARNKFLKDVLAVLGNCEFLKKPKRGSARLTDCQGGEENKEGVFYWNFHDKNSRGSEFFLKKGTIHLKRAFVMRVNLSDASGSNTLEKNYFFERRCTNGHQQVVRPATVSRTRGLPDCGQFLPSFHRT